VSFGKTISKPSNKFRGGGMRSGIKVSIWLKAEQEQEALFEMAGSCTFRIHNDFKLAVCLTQGYEKFPSFLTRVLLPPSSKKIEGQRQRERFKEEESGGRRWLSESLHLL
jgi:hypothetical protein